MTKHRDSHDTVEICSIFAQKSLIFHTHSEQTDLRDARGEISNRKW